MVGGAQKGTCGFGSSILGAGAGVGFREGVWIPGGASDWVGGRECGFQGGGVDLGGRRERAWTLTERRSEYKLGGTKLRTGPWSRWRALGSLAALCRCLGHPIRKGPCGVSAWPRVGDADTERL